MHKHTQKFIALGYIAISLASYGSVQAQSFNFRLSGNVQYNGSPAVNRNYNASAERGQYLNNNLNSIAPTVRSNAIGGNGGLSTPSLALSGAKKEGRIPVQFSRQIAVSGGSLGNESVRTIIKHDLTPPRCPRSNEWPQGLSSDPDDWAPGIIQFRTGDATICHDQLTEGGTVKNTGAGCLTPGELVKITRHGATATFPLEDRVGNSRSCTTPPAKIDCRPPLLNDLEVQHVGLSLDKERPGSQANPNKFKADDGELNLIIDVEDSDASTSCGRSGLNWNELINGSELAQLERNLANAAGSKELLELELDSYKADEITARGNLLSNLISKVAYDYQLQIWSDVLQDMNNNSSALKTKTQALTNEISTLAGKSLNDNKWDQIIAELEKPKYIGLSNRDGLLDDLRSINLEFENNRIRNYTSKADNLITGLKIPLPSIVSLNPNIDSDESDIDIYMEQWSRDILEDYGHIVTGWSTFITDSAQEINDKYEEYLEVKTDSEGSIDQKMTSIGNFDATDSFKGVVTSLKNGLDTNRTNASSAIGKVDNLNSRINSALSTVKSSSSSTLNTSVITGLINEGNQVIQTVSTLNADVSGNIGVLGKPANTFNYYMDAPTTAKVDQIEIASQDFGAVVELNKTTIQDIQDETADLETQIANYETEMEETREELQEKMDVQLEDIGDELQTLGISHVEIRRIGTGTKQFFVNTDINPEYGTTYEWNINQYQFDGENFPIFSQAGRYRVDLRIYDYAKNPINPHRTVFITIKPAEADKSMIESTMLNNCNEDGLYANLQDSCQLNIIAQDRFENLIATNSPLTIVVDNQNIDGSYDIIETLGNNYPNGIRLYPKSDVTRQDGKEFFNWNSPSNGQKTIRVRSILPSVEVFPTLTGSAMMNVKTKNLPLKFISPKIDPRGNITAAKQAFDLTAPSKFNPWVFLYMSDRPDNQPPTTPWEVKLNTKQCLYTYSTTENAVKDLPTNFDVFVKAEADGNLEFYDENLNETSDGYKILFRGVNGDNEEEIICFHVRPGGGQTSLDFGFTSKIDYILEGKRIRIPGNPLGLNAAGTCMFPTNPICCGQPGGLPMTDPKCTSIPPTDPCDGKSGKDLLCCETPSNPRCNSCPDGSNPNCVTSCSGFTGDDRDCCLDPTLNKCNVNWRCPGLTGRALDCCLNPLSEYCVDLPPTCSNQFSTPMEVLCCQEPSNSFCRDTVYLTAGADIEGGVLAENEDFVYITSDDNDLNDQALFLGGDNSIDVREEATRNAYELTRGINPENNVGATMNLDLSSLDDGGITYIKGGLVRIGVGGTPGAPVTITGGSHTVIVEDGNVLIAGDYEYGLPDDILGVMVINTDPSPAPSTGNIFVHQGIRKFAGVFFSDGSLTTTQSMNAPSFAENFDRETINGTLDRQLILTGALLTRNTLGGSELLDIRNPWGQPITLEESQKYDLHYVRRYTPVYNPNTGLQTNQNKCTQLNGLDCYDNKRSFIIRIDPKIGYNPPPGFSVNENANFQTR